jgi:hypothetical protein
MYCLHSIYQVKRKKLLDKKKKLYLLHIVAEVRISFEKHRKFSFGQVVDGPAAGKKLCINRK